MLSAYLVIPKAIRELSMEFVDRYFRAILSEAMQDGLVKGYLDGDGKTGPIGIFRQIGTTIHTNYPTTVLTSENEISVEYVADTEAYIGKRIKEENQSLQKQILEIQNALISQKISGV